MSRAPDYNSITEPLADSMNMVATHMLRAPQIRYRLDLEARKLASQQMVDQAQAGNYTAQAEGHRQKARGDQQRNDAFDRLNAGGGLAKLHGMISGTTPFNPHEYDAAMSDFTQAFGVSGQDAIGLIKQGAQAAAAKTGVPARANAEATGNITQIAIRDADNTNGAEMNRERLQYSLDRPMPVSRDSGVWNPKTKTWDVAKPDRPAGNVNNLYTPADRALLSKAGEGLAEAYAADDKEAILKWKTVIKQTAAKYGQGGSAASPAAKFNTITTPAANQAQDPDDPSEPVEEPAGMEDDARMPMPAQQPQAAGTNAPAANVPKLQNQADIDYALKDANDAINGTGNYKGRRVSRAEVMARLKAMGITLKE
jgi:hypothetical protein